MSYGLRVADYWNVFIVKIVGGFVFYNLLKANQLSNLNFHYVFT